MHSSQISSSEVCGNAKVWVQKLLATSSVAWRSISQASPYIVCTSLRVGSGDADLTFWSCVGMNVGTVLVVIMTELMRRAICWYPWWACLCHSCSKECY